MWQYNSEYILGHCCALNFQRGNPPVTLLTAFLPCRGLLSLAILECRFCIWPCLNWLAHTFLLFESQEVPKLAKLHLVLQPEKLAYVKKEAA